jgi:Cytochrome c oxidase subunit IV
MNTAWKLFAGGAAFFGVVDLIYWFTSYEEAGTVMLGLAVGGLALIAVYLRIHAQRTGIPPEDRPDAQPADATGDIGYFPASSIWPFVMATGVVVLANAFVFGVWLAILGGFLFLTAVVGYAKEAHA